MDMWNWLLSCYKEKSLNIEEMEEILEDGDLLADKLWDDFELFEFRKTEYVKDQVKAFLNYIKNKEKKDG